MKFKAIIFDWDDTLVKSREIKWAHHRAVAKKFYNIDITDDELLAHWGKPFNELITLLYKNSDTVEKMIEFNRTLEESFPKELYDDTLDTINKIIDKNVKLSIISATNKDFIMNDLNRLGFPISKFFLIQGAKETSFHKPDPRVFDSVLKELDSQDIEKSKTVYVGDAVMDLKAAKAAGLKFVGITRGLVSKEEFDNLGADFVIKNLSDLSRFI